MYEYRAFVRKVYDGDTITVDIDLGFDVILKTQKIRLLKINAPEVRGAQREAGLKSRNALRDKIGNKWIKLKTQKDKKGKYGRLLGILYQDTSYTKDYNQILLEEGHATYYDGGKR